MKAGVERPENAIESAAIRDPMPEAAIRNPYPVASVWSTSCASAGMITPKFIPNSDTSPTITVASRTTFVRRT